MINWKKNPESVNHKLWCDEEPDKKIDTVEVSNISQAVWEEWKLYTEMSDYLNESSSDRIRLDDYNVYMIIQKMQKNKRDAVWPVNFNQQENIRALRTNYDNEAVMMNNVDKDCYAIFKSYYQLCEEERREAGIKTCYSMH